MEFDLPKDTSSIIKVIGVGGGGSNAVNHMYNQGIVGVDFIVCNTDRQALDISPVPLKIQLGASLTEGRGAGAIPEIGKNSAIENIDEIKAFLNKNTKMVFVTAGMGGGTGTGAAPVIAQVAKEMGILTVGIVTVPFGFEGRKRRQQAEDGLDEMRRNVDTLLVINNERLREISGNLTIGNAFMQADDVLTMAAKGIAEVISVTGAINVDFNDVNTVMKDSGVAIMGSAMADGNDRSTKAVQQALSSPLLNDNDISGAKYVLLNITYGAKEVLMDEITEITDFIQDQAGSTADVIWGHGYDETLGDKICVTIIATGFNSSPITGFEKAPEKTVRPLEEEPKKEITAPLESPTHINTFIPKTVSETINEEPFLKPEVVINETPTFVPENRVELTEEVIPHTPIEAIVGETISEPFIKNEEVKVETPNLFEWGVETTATVTPTYTPEPVQEPAKEEVKKFQLEDELEQKANLDNYTARPVLSQEEQQRRAQERLQRIQEYTAKLKRADGINEFENEPAYVRRNIQLDNSKHSETERVSRFGISDSDNGTTLRSNNSFLHDNVD
ncbi:MAG: cell division protein FtsZ [Flavobacteriia bacterium]|nr:cell division protein FtsZ [Flavobacteriia bacterium]